MTADEPPSISNLVLCADPDCDVAWAYRDPPAEHYHPRPHGPEQPDPAIEPPSDSPITMWMCSARCWQEGGPHDEHCRPIHFDRREEEPTDGN